MTKAEFKQLSKKQRWDILVALRGPDLIGGDTLKWFTSSVIRAHVQEIVRPEGGSALINSDLKVIPMSYGNGGGFGGFDLNHFAGHVIEAASIIGIPVISVPLFVFLNAVGKDKVRATKMFIEALEGNGSNPDHVKPFKLHYQKLSGYKWPEAVPQPTPAPPSPHSFTVGLMAGEDNLELSDDEIDVDPVEESPL